MQFQFKFNELLIIVLARHRLKCARTGDETAARENTQKPEYTDPNKTRPSPPDSSHLFFRSRIAGAGLSGERGCERSCKTRGENKGGGANSLILGQIKG
jgi:hypothetical protein